MATKDYAKIQRSALRLLTKFGRDVEIRRSAGGTFNEASGSISGSADQVGTIKVVTLPASSRNIEGLDNKYAEELIRGEVKFVIAEAVNVPFKPRAGDRLKFDNEEWEVIGNTAVEPAGVAVIHKMGIVRK